MKRLTPEEKMHQLLKAYESTFKYQSDMYNLHTPALGAKLIDKWLNYTNTMLLKIENQIFHLHDKYGLNYPRQALDEIHLYDKKIKLGKFQDIVDARLTKEEQDEIDVAVKF